MKYLSLVIVSLFVLISCQKSQPGPASEDQSAASKSVEQKLLLSSSESIQILNDTPFANPENIDTSIIAECTELGRQFSESTRKFASKNSIRLEKMDAVDFDGEGKSLKIVISNAFSSGNAFIGHRKSVSTKVELYEDGQLIDTYATTRNSSGGFWGGFKGSCSVLHRTVNTLGSDIAKWLNDKVR